MREYDNTVVQNISDGANIDDHISFIEKLIHTYWTENSKPAFEKQLNHIKEKQNDKNMYLAVIGEFSTGKSSFINAIIKDELLKTDILQATTAANTSILYGNDLDCKVSYNDGTSEEYLKNLSLGKKFWRNFFTPKLEKLKNEIREYIDLVTSEESISLNVKEVIIKHPSTVLKNGLVIIDTPGINATNKRHEEVTKEAIKSLADAAIIIISAEKQLPKTLIDFVKNNLSEVLSKCIFIVNKMDLIGQKEQKRVLQYIANRIKLEFETDKVNIFPYTPLAVLRAELSDVDFNCDTEYEKLLLEQSHDSEKKIYEVLRQQRILIQLQKLVVITKYLFDDLEKELYELKRNYSLRHKALEDNKIKDLNKFINEQKKLHQDAVLKKCDVIINDASNIIFEAKKLLIKEVNDKIFAMSNYGQLKNYMKKELQKTIEGSIEGLSANIPAILSKLIDVAVKQKHDFEEEFIRLYNNLSTLGGTVNINRSELDKDTNNLLNNSFNENIGDIKNVVKAEDNKLGGIALKGAGAGAVFGTIIFPGVGTAIGALIGSFASFLFRKPLDELKNEYFNQVKNVIEESFLKIDLSVHELEEKTLNSVIVELFIIIDNYFNRYDGLVKEMIRRDLLEKQKLENKSVQIEKDLRELNNRKIILEGTRARISEL